MHFRLATFIISYPVVDAHKPSNRPPQATCNSPPPPHHHHPPPPPSTTTIHHLLRILLSTEQAREIRELMKKRDKEEEERAHRAELERLDAEKALSMRVRTETATEVADRLGRENDNLRRMIADLADQKNKLERLYVHHIPLNCG
jgi:hypothetical protein